MPDKPSPALDVQDPLPESNWFWRRVFTFAVTAFILWRLWYVLDDLADTAAMSPEQGIRALLSACRHLLMFAFALVTYYLLAPSAEQVTKMIKTASLLKHGVQIATRTVKDGERQETAQTVGQPPQPVAPPVAEGHQPLPIDPTHEPTPPTQGGSGVKETRILE